MTQPFQANKRPVNEVKLTKELSQLPGAKQASFVNV